MGEEAVPAEVEWAIRELLAGDSERGRAIAFAILDNYMQRSEGRRSKKCRLVRDRSTAR